MAAPWCGQPLPDDRDGWYARAMAFKESAEEAEAEVEMLRFCLDQARIVLEHFSTELPDWVHRDIAKGGLIASAPPGTLPGESPS